MFLRGIFGSCSDESLTLRALDDISYFFDNTFLPEVVKKSLFELTTSINSGVTFNSNLDLIKYSYGVERNEALSKYHEKIRRKEFNIHAFEENESRLPRGTVDENAITSEHSLVEQPKVSWLTLSARQTVEAKFFEEEVKEHIQTYNLVSDYLERTYGFSFKKVLLNSMNGVSDAETYLKQITDYENDKEFKEALDFLSSYEEFYDYLYRSESEVLTFDFSLKSDSSPE